MDTETVDMTKLFRLDGTELREFTPEEYAQYETDQLEATDETPTAD